MPIGFALMLNLIGAPWKPIFVDFFKGGESRTPRFRSAHFTTELRSTGLDATKRLTLMRLLVEEEDRFGYGEEQLAIAERYLADCQHSIATLSNLTDGLSRNGADTTPENDLLVALTDLHGKFQAYKQMILDCRDKETARWHPWRRAFSGENSLQPFFAEDTERKKAQ
jgi:hypothetical protein